MPICQGCGDSFANEFKFCPNCGRARPEKASIDINLHVTEPEHENACPVCHRIDAVKKVSAITSENPSLTQFAAPPLAVNQQLVSTSTTCLVIIGFILILFAVFSLVFSSGSHPAENVTNCLIGMFIIGLPMFLIGLNKQRDEKASNSVKIQQEVVENARSRYRWEKIYYCLRDDCAYIPGEENTFSSQNISNLLI